MECSARSENENAEADIETGLDRSRVTSSTSPLAVTSNVDQDPGEHETRHLPESILTAGPVGEDSISTPKGKVPSAIDPPPDYRDHESGNEDTRLFKMIFESRGRSVEDTERTRDVSDTVLRDSVMNPRLFSPQSSLGAGGRLRPGSVCSAASGRAEEFTAEQTIAKAASCSPLAKKLNDVRAPGGYTRYSDRELAGGSNGVPGLPVFNDSGVPLAGILEENLEEALSSGACPPLDELFGTKTFAPDQRLLGGLWEATFICMMSSILYALWMYEGRSRNVPDIAAMVASSAGTFGIVARSFSARGYLGVAYAGHVSSGVVNLRLFHAGKVNETRRIVGAHENQGFLVSCILNFAAFVLGFLDIARFVVESVLNVVRFVFDLVVGSENDYSWALGRGIVRCGKRIIVLPIMQKRAIRASDRGVPSSVKWPGGARRTYYGSSAIEGEWALHFPNRGAFLADLGCDKVSVQFGEERRLVTEVGHKKQSFAIVARDGRGGLLLIPTKDSAGVRVRLSNAVFAGATGSVTILMDAPYPKKPARPGDHVAQTLELWDKPFFLDVTTCGVGSRKDVGTEVYDVLDGAGAGAITDNSPLWGSLSTLSSLESATARWAAGYFGGRFSELHELGEGGVSTRHNGPGEGIRCVTVTPADVSRSLPKCDVVVGVRAQDRRMVRLPVCSGEASLGINRLVGPRNVCGITLFAGVRGDYCLIPGGLPGKWRTSEGKVEKYEESEECLVIIGSKDATRGSVSSGA